MLLTSASSSQLVSVHGSLIISPNNQTITYVKTSNFTGPNYNPSTGVLSAGTYTVTFRSATNGFVDSLNGPLDGLGNGNALGSNYVATFVVTASPVIVAVPSFARGPDGVDQINLPNSFTGGIPVNVSVGLGITAGKFTLQYNSALLSIAGVSVNTSLAGAALSLDMNSSAGTAILDFSSPTPLTQTGAVRLGGLVATVPNSAASIYKSKALLHWSAVSLSNTSGSIPVEGGDAVEINAYFGDALGSGALTGGDASLISGLAGGFDTSTANGTLGGYSAYPFGDPVILSDLNNDGLVDASDVTLLYSYLSGTPRPQLPPPPPALAGTIVTSGPDPSLSLPTVPQASPGGPVVVPVNIDTAMPAGSTGMIEAVLALRYDSRAFDVSAS